MKRNSKKIVLLITAIAILTLILTWVLFFSKKDTSIKPQSAQLITEKKELKDVKPVDQIQVERIQQF